MPQENKGVMWENGMHRIQETRDLMHLGKWRESPAMVRGTVKVIAGAQRTPQKSFQEKQMNLYILGASDIEELKLGKVA